MKMYLFYLMVKPDFIDTLNDDEAENFKSYQPALSSGISQFNPDSESFVFLHSFTNKREYAEYFKEVYNMDIFVEMVNNIGKDEYEEFSCFAEDLEIRPYSLKKEYGYQSNDKESELIVTTNRDLEIFTEIAHSQCEQKLLGSSSYPYNIFKDKYIKALDKILYCTYNQLQSEDSDVVDYNFTSYGVTAEGFVNHQVSVRPNFCSMWVNFYSFLMKK